MYFPAVEAETGRLVTLQMVPIQVRRMQATRADRADTEWIGNSLSRASSKFGTEVELMVGVRGSGDVLVLNGVRPPGQHTISPHAK
jgi:hypothetical protein